MKKAKVLIISMLSLFSFYESFSWGQKGHDIVADIAGSELKCRARRAVAKALEGRSMVYYSSWMDNIRDIPAYSVTKTWHYANVDEGYTYESMPKQQGGDIISALEMVVEQLKDHRHLSDSLENVYLKYLIHLVGDLHCPMHAGRLSDRGGNDLKIKWFGSNTNLHSLWDTALIEDSRKWSYTEWRQNITYITKSEKKSVMSGSVKEWFDESVEAARQIYNGVVEDGTYSWKYMYDYYPLLERQLSNAGYRLAYLLNEIYC